MSTAPAAEQMEEFVYDDDIVRKFLFATFFWGFVGMLVGLIVALQMVLPAAANAPGFGWLGALSFLWGSDGLIGQYLTFGRLRPLHTNAVIFAFAGNAIFTAVYYSTQRLCKARMYSDALSRAHFWGWQAIIVAAAITLPMGITTGKEYAELEWIIDIAIAVVWLGFFGGNVLGTLLRRRERHLYVAIWFYIASIVTVAVLHVFNSLEMPAGPLKSYSVYAGVQDAFMQWWYGHNAVAFFLTTPFLGLMYYFLPKAANRPVFSYRLSIIHFWSLVFIYIWAGPHHLHYTALAAWASTLGMLFSLMLWMPSWGGMINGLLTLRGAWHKVAADPVLKFFVVGVTFYGMSTFEGPMLSIKSVNALSHYTDWTIAHVHGGTLGWNGMMTFGMVYWLLPRLFQTPLWSKKLAEVHFWLGTFGILCYVMPIYVAGLTQGLMWRAFGESGQLAYGDFVETVMRLLPLYWARALGGSVYLAGVVLCGVNFAMTWARRPATYEEPVHRAPALSRRPVVDPAPRSRLSDTNLEMGHALDRWLQGSWHRRIERLPVRFTIWVVIAIGVASLAEIIPTFLIRSNVPTISSVKPYTPLELMGREIYISEGCYNCHSQMIRPIYAETVRYGEYSKPGEFVYDHPFQWGSRRIGPDLGREGGLRSDYWHYEHLRDPRSLAPDSIMPSYEHLLEQRLDFGLIPSRLATMRAVGVPYDDQTVRKGIEMARTQAEGLARTLAGQAQLQDPEEQEALAEDVRGSKVVALIAYLQRLGKDIFNTEGAGSDGAAQGSAAEDGGG